MATRRRKRRTVGEAMDLLDANAERTLARERTAAEKVPAALREDVRGVTTWLAQEWVHRYGDLAAPAEGPSLVPELRDRLDAIEPDLSGALDRAAREALADGVQQGAEEAGLSARGVRARIDKTTAEAISGADGRAKGKLDGATLLLRHLDVRTHADAMHGVGVAHQSVTSAEASTEWVVNAAVNQGTAAVAEHHGMPLLWAAERDGCVVCMALSGVVADDGVFPADATFGRRTLPVWKPPLTGPPRHPRCRCRVTPWRGSAPGHPEHDLPASLKREAQRSIVKGWALESEPESVRRDAAARLLDSATLQLPKTVVSRARKALDKKGPFKTPVPSGSGNNQ